jgi:hypothetical protein
MASKRRRSRSSRRGSRTNRPGNAVGRLRPASELRAERTGRIDAAEKRRREEGLSRAIKEIEKAQAEGRHEVYSLTFSPWVVSQLKAAGYKVEFLRAAGMGDVDSHLIQW